MNHSSSLPPDPSPSPLTRSPGFLEDGQRVYYAFASFNTTETIKDFYRGAINFDDLWATHDKMVTALAAAEAAGDGSLGGGGVQSLLFYPRMVSSRTFLESGVQNLIIGLVLAATVITLMTMNWKVALLSAASLVVIPLSLFMVLATARIKINIIEVEARAALAPSPPPLQVTHASFVGGLLQHSSG